MREVVVATAAVATAGIALYAYLRRRKSASSTRRTHRKTPPIAEIAVCGAGWWSQGWHLPHLSRHPHARGAAIVEPSPNPRSAISALISVDELGKLYDVPTFSSIDELLASPVAASLQGVVVCTSHSSHYELGVKALAKGLHVLMEKPMTTDVDEARKLAKAADDAAKRSNAKFMVNNTASWRKQAMAAKEAVMAGSIGDVQHVLCVMHSALIWLFDDPANLGWTKTTGKMSGNGFGYGQASHILAWVFQVTGLIPSEAYCVMSLSENSGADMADAAVIRCTNGAAIVFSGSASVPGNAHADSVNNENVHSVGKHLSLTRVWIGRPAYL